MPAVGAVIGGIALNLAIGVGASVLSGLLAPQKQSATVSANPTTGFSFQVEMGEQVPVRAVFGLGRPSGQLMYVNTYGDNNSGLQYVVKVGHGWHDGLDSFLVNEKPVSLVGSNSDEFGFSIAEWTRDGQPYMWVKYYTGAAGQAADPQLVANANPSGRWTSAHKMTGCAYFIVTCKYDADFYGTTFPTFGSVWRGLRLYDLRDGTQTWGDQSTYRFTQNPVIIRWNYRRGVYVNGVRILGMGFPAFANDSAGYIAAANRCDETYHDPVTNTTWPIFQYGREIGDDETKLNVLSELDASYCGSSFKRGGGDVPLPAQQLVATLTLTDADRLIQNQGSRQTVHADFKGTVSSKKTCWTGQFVSSDLGYALGAYTPRIDTDLESVIGGRRSVTMNQPYEVLQTRAQLRAEIALRRQFYPATRTETFGPKALVLEPGDPFTRQCEWGSMMMIVEQVQQLSDRAGVIVTMSQWDNSIVPASGDSFITLPTEPGATIAPADRTIAVSGLGVVPYPKEGGGAIHPYARASWTPITDPNVDQVLVRLWPTAGTEATDGQDYFASSKLTSTTLCGPLVPDTGYTYKAIPVRNDARICVWTNTGTLTTGDESTPFDVADIPDNSLAIQKFSNDVQNLLGPVLDDITGKLNDHDALFGELSELLAGQTATSLKQFSGIAVQNTSQQAAIVTAESVSVDFQESIATLETNIVAKIGPIGAGMDWKAVSTATPAFGISTLSFSVLATDGTFAPTAAFELLASVGLAGSVSQINLLADNINFADAGGNFVTSPFFTAVDPATMAAYAAIANLRVNDIVALDGVSFELNGTITNAYGEPFLRIG